MRNRNSDETSTPSQGVLDTDSDRYPSFQRVLSRIADSDVIPDGPIERLEISCLAGGDATFRVWPARAEFPEGGYLPPE